jgi:hypothetical protein
MTHEIRRSPAKVVSNGRFAICISTRMANIQYDVSRLYYSVQYISKRCSSAKRILQEICSQKHRVRLNQFHVSSNHLFRATIRLSLPTKHSPIYGKHLHSIYLTTQFFPPSFHAEAYRPSKRFVSKYNHPFPPSLYFTIHDLINNTCFSILPLFSMSRDFHHFTLLQTF